MCGLYWLRTIGMKSTLNKAGLAFFRACGVIPPHKHSGIFRMKKHISIGIFALMLTSTKFLQGAPAAGQSSPIQTVNVPAPTPYAITVQDGNSRRWEQTTYEVDPSGQVFSKQHS
jgi:hypothetical protein